MNYPDETQLKQLRQKYHRNALIVLDKMDNTQYNQAPPKGTHGTVYTVDGAGNIVPVCGKGSGTQYCTFLDICVTFLCRNRIYK